MHAKLGMVLQVEEAAVQATVTQLIDCLLRDTPGEAQTHRPSAPFCSSRQVHNHQYIILFERHYHHWVVNSMMPTAGLSVPMLTASTHARSHADAGIPDDYHVRSHGCITKDCLRR